MKQLALVVFGGILLFGVVMAARTTELTQLFNPAQLQSTIEAYGVLGPLVFMGVYILACLLFFPGTPLTLLAGVLFGPLLGTLYTVVGATLGATAAFCFSRLVRGKGKEFSTGAIGTKLAQYDSAIEKNGFMTVLFLRFVPLFPFNGLNFALGLTRVRTRDYVLGTLLGIVPGSTAYVFFGDSLATLSVVKIAVAVLAVLLLSIIGKFVMQKYGK